MAGTLWRGAGRLGILCLCLCARAHLTAPAARGAPLAPPGEGRVVDGTRIGTAARAGALRRGFLGLRLRGGDPPAPPGPAACLPLGLVTRAAGRLIEWVSGSRFSGARASPLRMLLLLRRSASGDDPKSHRSDRGECFVSQALPAGPLPAAVAHSDSLEALESVNDDWNKTHGHAPCSHGVVPLAVSAGLPEEPALVQPTSPPGVGDKEPKMDSFEVLLDCLPDGAPPDRVQVVLHRKYCRTRRDDIEKGIDAEWQRLTAREPRMWWYDGTLFRLASSQRWLDVDGTQEVKLECGITRYRSFLGTNMAASWDRIPQSHMSDPLSCVVLVCTYHYICFVCVRA